MSINKLEIELAQSKAKLAKLEQELEKLNNDAFSIYQVHRTTEISRRDYFAASIYSFFLKEENSLEDAAQSTVKAVNKIIAELDKAK